jgi:hypothetical protein
MSQRSKVIHDFKSVNLSQSQLQFTDAGSSITLGAAESGDIVTLNATSGSAVTLPSPSTGLLYRFIITNTGPHTLTAPTACINGAVVNAVFNTGSNLATGAAKTSIAATAGSVIGDSLTLMGTGTNYFLSGNVSNFNAVKFA